MATSTGIVLRGYGAGQIPPLEDVIADIWADAHPELVDKPGGETDGLSVPGLRRQLTGHLRHPGFNLVIAHAPGGDPVGFGYAFPCSADYWFGPDLVAQAPPGARTERLMGLCELAVRRPWQGRSIGTALHDALVEAIAPQWASLLVHPDNAGARALYERLGYGYLGPYTDPGGGTVYDLLVKRVGD
jgi:ribosomal protein S18 acetylase RimI-like enzyme